MIRQHHVSWLMVGPLHERVSILQSPLSHTNFDATAQYLEAFEQLKVPKEQSG